MKWRLYRLPGSRHLWHVDGGPGTLIVNVLGFKLYQRSYSVDVGDGSPRAWIEIPFKGTELHIINGIAIWQAVKCTRICATEETKLCAAAATVQTPSVAVI